MFIDVLIILNNFFHDLAAAIWFCGTLTLFFVYRQTVVHKASGAGFALGLFRQIRKITNWSMVFVVLGGIVRAFNYRQYEWLPALGRGQVALLIVKHVLLTVIVLGGIWLQFSLAAKMKKHEGK